MDLFYDPEFNTQTPYLNDKESHHCIKVLRNTIGQHISITNGNGSIWKGTILQIEGKRVLIEVNEDFKRPIPVSYKSIAVAPPKSTDRLEWMIEKSVELGVKEIFLIHTSRSERKKANIERLYKKAISAIKQSHNPFLPEIHPFLSFDDYLNINLDNYQNKLIAHTSDSNYIDPIQDSTTITLIGPEGGFTKAEIKKASANNYSAISLGENILRTETAAIVSLNKTRRA